MKPQELPIIADLVDQTNIKDYITKMLNPIKEQNSLTRLVTDSFVNPFKKLDMLAELCTGHYKSIFDLLKFDEKLKTLYAPTEIATSLRNQILKAK